MANNKSSSSSQSTIAGIVSQSGDEFDQNNQDFDILLEALETADLVDALDDASADLTVFAPTDAAFIKLAQDFGYHGTDEAEAFGAIANALTDLGEGDPVPLLQDILLYHVSPGGKNQAEIKASGEVETLLEGASFEVKNKKLVDNEPDLNNPSFIKDLANIEAANGTIQGIDRVLIPIDIPGNESSAQPTIADIVSESGDEFDQNNQDFDILLEALETADLVDALDDASADLTVFAPTDAAFIKLAQDFGYHGTDEAEAFGAIANALTDLGEGDPVPLLQDILLYHVSPGGKNQAEIKASGKVETLLEDASFKVKNNKLVDNEPDLINPSFIKDLANIEAGNGTIQGIDRVLIPIDIPGNDITGNSQGDTLVGVESKDNLVLFNNGADRVVFKLNNITDFIDDLFMGQATISFKNNSSFGDLSFQESYNSTLVFGGEKILVEVFGVFSDAFNFW